jgi:hypothetical protein
MCTCSTFSGTHRVLDEAHEIITVASHNRGNIPTLVKPGIMKPPTLAAQSILVGLRAILL